MAKIKCPKCGNETEFYVNQTYSGKGRFFFNMDGSEADNSEMHLNTDYKLSGKYIYCADCDAKVEKIESLRQILGFMLEGTNENT